MDSDSPRIDRMSRADLELEVKLLRQKVFSGTSRRDLERCQAKVARLEAQIGQEPWTYLPLYDMDTVKELARG